LQPAPEDSSGMPVPPPPWSSSQHRHEVSSLGVDSFPILGEDSLGTRAPKRTFLDAYFGFLFCGGTDARAQISQQARKRLRLRSRLLRPLQCGCCLCPCWLFRFLEARLLRVEMTARAYLVPDRWVVRLEPGLMLLGKTVPDPPTLQQKWLASLYLLCLS
jgi:hypothetical protein